MGDSCNEVELVSPCPVIFCSSTQQSQALLLLELQLWQHCIKSPRLEGLTQLESQDEGDVFPSSWGIHDLSPVG